MGRVVTVVAAPSGGVTTILELTGEGFIDDYLTILTAMAPECQAKNTVLRASSLGDAVTALIADRDQHGAPELVQLVGHGNTGALGFASSFGAVPMNDLEVYTLDSDSAHYLLADDAIASPTRVRLLGCNVVDDVADSPDGPVLLFDLACLWDCVVEAPTMMIGREHFDECGLFRATEMLARAEPAERKVIMPGLAGGDARMRRRAEAPARELAGELVLSRVLAGGRRRGSEESPLSREESDRVLAGTWSSLEVGPGLLPELRFAARRGPDEVSVDVLSGGRILRVQGDAFARFDGPNDDPRKARSLWERGDPQRRALLRRLQRAANG